MNRVAIFTESALLTREIARAHLDFMRGASRTLEEALRERASRSIVGADVLHAVAADAGDGVPLEVSMLRVPCFLERETKDEALRAYATTIESVAKRPLGEKAIGLLELAIDMLADSQRVVS